MMVFLILLLLVIILTDSLIDAVGCPPRFSPSLSHSLLERELNEKQVQGKNNELREDNLRQRPS